MGMAERVVKRDLAQVTVYLTNDAIRASAQDKVAPLLDAQTKVVVGHSLGSILAYEAVHNLEQPLPPIGHAWLSFRVEHYYLSKNPTSTAGLSSLGQVLGQCRRPK